MKTIKNKFQKMINAYVDNELNTKDKYHVKKLIETDANMRAYYNDLLKYKKQVDFSTEIKASSNFEKNLMDKINSLEHKENKIAFVQKFLDSFSLQRVSYAVGTLVVLFFFSFGIYNIFLQKRSVSTEMATSPTTSQSSDRVALNNFSAPSATNSRAKSVIRVNEPRRVENRRTARVPQDSIRTRRQSAPTIAQRNNNQSRARQIFNRHEASQRGQVIRRELASGMKHYYQRNYSRSRAHFRTVMQKANRSSIQYLQARDYLNRMSNR